jgi:hypothetical protein
VTPVLIGKSQSDAGSDVLVVMGGTAASGDVPRLILSSGTSSNILRLDSTTGLAEGDLGLVSANGTTDCLLEQVHASTAFADTSANDALPLGSTYYTASGSTTSLSTLAASGSAYFTPLGNVNAGNTQFQMFGVGSNNTLYGYDLLMSNGTDASQAIADGVAELHALYGTRHQFRRRARHLGGSGRHRLRHRHHDDHAGHRATGCGRPHRPGAAKRELRKGKRETASCLRPPRSRCSATSPLRCSRR